MEEFLNNLAYISTISRQRFTSKNHVPLQGHGHFEHIYSNGMHSHRTVTLSCIEGF
jgi:hypothetical protein